MKKTLTETDVLNLIDGLVKKLGTQEALAQKWGISAPYLTDILKGRRGISANILTRLGLRARTVTTYEVIK